MWESNNDLAMLVPWNIWRSTLRMDEPFPSAVKTAKTAPEVEAFFDAATSTLTYVVTSPGTRRCTIIDPVLDYDESSAAVSTLSADTVVRYVR